MKIRLLASIVLIVLLVLSFGFSASQTAQPVIIQGSQTPELIPTFSAWETFTLLVEEGYKNNVLDPYLARRAKLSQIKGYQSVRESAVSLIADFASYSQRELTRIKNKQNDLRELRNRGLMATSDYSVQFRSNISEQVAFLTSSCEMLRDNLVGLDEEVGSAIWNQLVLFCNTHIKKAMSLSSDETADDLAVRAIWKRFDPKPISIQRK